MLAHTQSSLSSENVSSSETKSADLPQCEAPSFSIEIQEQAHSPYLESAADWPEVQYEPSLAANWPEVEYEEASLDAKWPEVQYEESSRTASDSGRSEEAGPVQNPPASAGREG